jgi:hypothetical protein
LIEWVKSIQTAAYNGACTVYGYEAVQCKLKKTLKTQKNAFLHRFRAYKASWPYTLSHINALYIIAVRRMTRHTGEL